MFLTKEEKLSRWGDTRKKGKRRFIILYGVIGYGFFMAVFWSLSMWYVDSSFNPYDKIPLAFILFPLNGLFVGWIIWRSNEKDYKERLNRAGHSSR